MSTVEKIKLWWAGTGLTDFFMLVAVAVSVIISVMKWELGFWSHAAAALAVLFSYINWNRFRKQLMEWGDDVGDKIKDTIEKI